MKQSSQTGVPHTYALNLITRYKLRITNRASLLKKNSNLKYIDALDEVCKKEGYKNYYMCKQIINALLERATFFGKQEQRIKSATVEVPEPNSKYYLFNGELVLQHDLSTPCESVLTPLHFSNNHTRWTGWSDTSNKIEMRVATPVNALQQINIFREINSKQIYVINKSEDMFLWLNYWGGEALVKEDLVKNDDFLSSWLEPQPCESKEGI